MAEVLITLGIIGVVAALTMPSLIVKYEKQRILNNLKKTYSEIAQALKLAEVEYGNPVYWEYGTKLSGSAAENFMNKYLVPYLNVVKNCGTGTGCLHGDVYSLTGYKNPSYGDSTTNTARIMVNSGYTIGVTSGGDYVNLQITLNNHKDKLVMGKDIFFFIISSERGLMPHGYNLTRDELIEHSNMGCSKKINTHSAGMHCTGLIVSDSWQISSEYPW